MSLYPVISQVTYPGAGDVDDCSIVATFWAARASGYMGVLPTIAQFREAAGKPDRPGPTGLFNREVWAGVQGTILRTLSGTYFDDPWPAFSEAIRNGEAGSLAVLSMMLPKYLQFGFGGAHRIGVQYLDGRWYVANPLARQGAAPLPCDEAKIASAALALGVGRTLAVTFPSGGLPGMLRVSDEMPKTVDIAVGRQLYHLDATPAVKVSVAQNDVYSPFRSGIYRAVSIMTSGVTQLLLVKSADCADIRPVGDIKHTMAVWIDGKPVWSETV